MVSSGYSLVVVLGLLSAVASLVVEHGLQYFWNTDLVALWYVESSRTRDRTHVPCIGRQILIHGTTREALEILCIFKTTFKIKGFWFVVACVCLSS